MKTLTTLQRTGPAPRVAGKPYYDDRADRKAQQDYYAGVTLDASPADNLRELSRLLERSHTSRLSYKPSQYLYPEVDVRPNGALGSIYSAQSVTERQKAVDGAVAGMASWAPFNPVGAATAMALTMGANALNCEHVVPQSWFGKASPMRGDLHHLFACREECNSSRGNTPYGEVAGAQQVQDCGSGSGQAFEPRGGKGAVARATLYFLARYPRKIKQYRARDVDTLLRWHQSEPPSLYERHRNACIEKLQGNRNPFIDHPEWAGRIDWSQAVGRWKVGGDRG